MALALMAQNNHNEPLPASPSCWLANPNRHKGATASLCLSLSPQAKAAILKSGSLFFEGRPHPVRAFTATKTKPNQCRSCWQLGHSEAWCRQATPVCSSCSQDHPSHHHSTVTPNAPHYCVLCKGTHPSWTCWCVNRHIQLAAQPPLPKKARAKKPKAALALGKSGIGYRVLREVWDIAEDWIYFIVKKSIESGSLPSDWLIALVAVIQKPGKDDYSSLCSYHPIALLECLSKVAERVMAHCLAYDAERLGLVPAQDCGHQGCPTTDALA
ncbi:hypothetical protein BOTBODRAFT_174086 [Botryobasidium botryosum FD-172 SS1]|uniref:Reverse transcriptase domain-containing protein n=1 Tax=Botryobasidium botryosum (strain FD-172 SS1) TaxID=930990 RepID=A0A067MKH3_BOTB1|nr:hypothetical protein BOTBODRAFT_174086 [Botryobasidium botryosum FD-172 SS1]